MAKAKWHRLPAFTIPPGDAARIVDWLIAALQQAFTECLR